MQSLSIQIIEIPSPQVCLSETTKDRREVQRIKRLIESVMGDPGKTSQGEAGEWAGSRNESNIVVELIVSYNLAYDGAEDLDMGKQGEGYVIPQWPGSDKWVTRSALPTMKRNIAQTG